MKEIYWKGIYGVGKIYMWKIFMESSSILRDLHLSCFACSVAIFIYSKNIEEKIEVKKVNCKDMLGLFICKAGKWKHMAYAFFVGIK